jgi:predicted dehydrogenase
MARLRMAVIGVGHLGKEHARILAQLPDVDLVGVADVNTDQAQTVARSCGTQAYSTYWPLLTRVDAATIVVPTTHHFAIAHEFLRHGIPLLVEKPLAATLDQAGALVEVANRRGVLLQVGHIERFNPAFEALQARPLQPKFVECERLGPFSGRSTDIGVVLDLMIHDLDLLLTLVGAPVCTVEGIGVSLFGGHEDVANARLGFANGCVANVTASRASPTPLRRLRLWAPEGYARLDFARRRLTLVQPSEQFRRHGLGLAQWEPATLALFKEHLFGHHLQVLDLDCRRGDQMTRELQEFVSCVQTGERPRCSGEDGRAAIALATRILESIRTHHWNGQADGPTGACQLPEPLGALFQPTERQDAA